MVFELNDALPIDARLTGEDETGCKDGQHEAETGPLLVTPKQAEKLLSVGKSTVYELINRGILERRHIGKAARITMRSIRKVAGI